jgi:hypothetical protein
MDEFGNEYDEVDDELIKMSNEPSYISKRQLVEINEDGDEIFDSDTKSTCSDLSKKDDILSVIDPAVVIEMPPAKRLRADEEQIRLPIQLGETDVLSADIENQKVTFLVDS